MKKRKPLPKLEGERVFIPCPLLKCGGYRAVEVCFALKCWRYVKAKCPSVDHAYKEMGYEQEQKKTGKGSRGKRKKNTKGRRAVQTTGLREAGPSQC